MSAYGRGGNVPAPVAQLEASSSSAVALSSDVEKMTIGSSAGTSAQHPVMSQQPPVSRKALRLPARPGYGSIGRRCIVRANHFLVKVADNDLHHYDVIISLYTYILSVYSFLLYLD